MITQAKSSAFKLRVAKSILQAGGIIAYPTDTIAGLGALPIYPQSIEKIIAFKQRKKNKGLILLGSNIGQFSDWIDPNDKNKLKKMNAKQDRPTTFLVHPHPYLNQKSLKLISGQFEKIAVRISKIEHIRELIGELNCPIISTSLNIAGKPTLTKNYQVKQFFSELDYCVDLNWTYSTDATHSQIIDLHSGKTIRYSD